jgi:hypothetical protein
MAISTGAKATKAVDGFRRCSRSLSESVQFGLGVDLHRNTHIVKVSFYGAERTGRRVSWTFHMRMLETNKVKGLERALA